jgi:hypothetical protein
MARKTKTRHVASSVKIEQKTAHSKILLGPYAFANSLGLTALIFTLIYAVMAWFGDYDAQVITGLFPVPFSFENWSILLGVAQIYVFSYVFGWIMAKIYNKTLSS